MSYYDNTKEYEARGIDYDLASCLDNNPQEAFTLDDIDKVLAVWEGENDGDDWRWVMRLKDGRFVFLQGGCDYTGWDCRSWALHSVANSADEAAGRVFGEQPLSADFFHMLKLAHDEYGAKKNEVHASLLKQLSEGKARTWREKMDDELGL